MSSELISYIAKRFATLVLIVVIAVSINFIIPRLLPGDPVATSLARMQVSGAGSSQDVAAVTADYKAKFGLDKPILMQYFNYWSDLLHLNLGVSFANFPQKVSTMIVRALPWSVGLLATATLLSFLIGSFLGARLAWPGRGRAIRTTVPAMMILSAVPFYLLAIILIYLFAVVLRVLPPAGGVDTTRIMAWNWATARDIAAHAILPVLAIALGSIGFWALGMRSQMVSILGEDYITFAHAKGLSPRRIFYRYGIRNAFLPQVTALAIHLGTVVSGAILVEVVFNYPGLGSLLYIAIRGQGLLRHPGCRADAYPHAGRASLHRRPDLSAARPEDPAVSVAASPRRAGRLNVSLIVGLTILGALVLFSLAGPFFVDETLTQVGAVTPRRPPGPEYILGTDSQGRDMLAVLVYSTPTTLKMGLVAGILGVGLGSALGLLAGQFGGALDTVIRVVSDSLMTVPAIAILVIIAGNIDRMTTFVMALVVASLSWMFTTRTVRAQVLSIRERPYVEVARVNGMGKLEVIFREVMPNVMPYIVASFVGTVSSAILAIIGLEALGLGAQSEPTLGNTIYWAQQSSALLRGYWWWWSPPIFVIALIFIGLFLTSAGFDRFANPRAVNT